MTTADYHAKQYLLTQAELRFFRVLRHAVAYPLTVAPKVRLADVVSCHRKRPSVFALAPITQKHLDFVLYDWRTSRIVGAVELDDSSHERPKAARRDELVNRILRMAEIPLLRIRAASAYELLALKDQLACALKSYHFKGAANASSPNQRPHGVLARRAACTHPRRRSWRRVRANGACR